jgi:hypothetical protein
VFDENNPRQIERYWPNPPQTTYFCPRLPRIEVVFSEKRAY